MNRTTSMPGARVRRSATEEPQTGRLDRTAIRVWLRMLSATALIERRTRRRMRETFGITLPRFDLLAQLHRAPEGLTMGELSRRLMVTGGNVTGLTERLVREGLIERRPSSYDRRVQIVRLTPAGERLLASILPVHHAWVQEAFAALDGAEMNTLIALLDRLKTHVRHLEHAGRGRP